jgi:FKBP-type peptidyl-prolyl cis-trans isomerase
VPTNQQRRDAERRRLQRQLEQRRAREAARKRMTLIGSIVGTLVVIAAVVLAIVLSSSGSGGNKNNAANGNPTTSPSPTTSTSSSALTSSAAPVPNPTQACAGVPTKATATFKGVTVRGATDLKHAPKVSSKGTATPGNLECQDLVVGKGKAATPTSSVTVQYTGALYKDGKVFDSSWTRGQPAQFSLTGVVRGFTEGIGGAGKVAPMHAGGRRIMILPASLGYGSAAQGPIPANSTLVFVVDLKSVSG